MTDVAMLNAMSKPAAKNLDAVWEEVNALGGTFEAGDDYGRGLIETVGRVLDIIESYGGMDPGERRRRGERLNHD